MKINKRLAAGAATMALASGLIAAAAPVGAAAPPPIDVSNDHVTCDTLTGSLKFANKLILQGQPGVTSNPVTVKIALDGCTDTDNANVSLKGQKFTSTLVGTTWTHGLTCNPDGTPTTPVGTGSSSCHATWLVGGVPDNADHFTDASGSFGSNSCAGIAGLSQTGGTTNIVWKTNPGAAKLFDSGHPTPGTATSVTTITNAWGSTPNDIFGIGRGMFQVGAITPTIPGLSLESTTGAFTGGDGGASGTFQGMLANSSASIGNYCFAKGLNVLTFALGTVTSG